MIAITFAVPEESSRFRRLLKEKRQVRVGALRVLEGFVGSQMVRVAHIGMGLEAAERNTSLLLESQRPEGVIAAGLRWSTHRGSACRRCGGGSCTWTAQEPLRGIPRAWCRAGAIVSRPSPLGNAGGKGAGGPGDRRMGGGYGDRCHRCGVAKMQIPLLDGCERSAMVRATRCLCLYRPGTISRRSVRARRCWWVI